MRLIDADTLEKTICEWIGRQGEGSYYVGYDDALCAAQDLIADAPTITPPNECEYCSGDPMRPLDWQYGLDHIFPDYKYCPMCGKKVRE